MENISNNDYNLTLYRNASEWQKIRARKKKDYGVMPAYYGTGWRKPWANRQSELEHHKKTIENMNVHSLNDYHVLAILIVMFCNRIIDIASISRTYFS